MCFPGVDEDGGGVGGVVDVDNEVFIDVDLVVVVAVVVVGFVDGGQLFIADAGSFERNAGNAFDLGYRITHRIERLAIIVIHAARLAKIEATEEFADDHHVGAANNFFTQRELVNLKRTASTLGSYLCTLIHSQQWRQTMGPALDACNCFLELWVVTLAIPITKRNVINLPEPVGNCTWLHVQWH